MSAATEGPNPLRAFLNGAGSVFCLWPEPLPMPPSDADAIAADWDAVAGDLRASLQSMPLPLRGAR